MRAGDGMKRTLPAKRAPLGAAGLLLLLAGCGGGDLAPAAFGRGQVADVPGDSLTVQRVRGGNPEVEPITAEPGNMWPEEEAPRATLADPEEAMRGIPSYTPGVAPSEPGTPPPPPPLRPRGSSSLPPPPLALRPDQRSTVAEPAVRPAPVPPRREGRPIPLPDGGFATGTGDTGRVQGLVTQGGGSGAVIDQGTTEVIILPDGRTEQRLRTR
jgi:hypothetical protein